MYITLFFLTFHFSHKALTQDYKITLKKVSKVITILMFKSS